MKRSFVLLLGALLCISTVATAKPKTKPVTVKEQMLFGVDMAEQELWSEALFRFRQAELIGGGTAAVYNNIAVAYEALGGFEKAREYYLKALEVDTVKSKTSSNLRRNYSRFIEFYQSFQPEGEDEQADAEGAEKEASEEASEPATGS